MEFMRRFFVALLAVTLLMVGVVSQVVAQDVPVVRIIYFWRVGCTHCAAVEEEVLVPLQEQYGDQLEIRMLEAGAAENPANYELLIRIEEAFDVPPERRGFPTLVIGGEILIGEEEIRSELGCILDSCIAAGGTTWPSIPGLEEALEGEDSSGSSPPLIQVGPGIEPVDSVQPGDCDDNAEVICIAEGFPVWMAYFYEVGCQECSRAEADIEYFEVLNPGLIVDEFNIYDDLPLAQWLAERAGREDIHTPMVFIGEDMLVGGEEITPQNLESLLARYAPTGAERVWDEFDPEAHFDTNFVGFLTVLLAGLVDGLNPCAFATLIFFISYLAASQRQGREMLAAGGAFTLGVFLAYLAVGLGLYRLLDVVFEALPWVDTLRRVVYGLTALFCVVLAVFSFRDYLKARQGGIAEMALSLPEFLRRRTRAAIRTGQRSRAFVMATFFTGILVSLLELACTGQIYLPTIIYMTGTPGMRTQGTLFLVLYNVAFIVPLVVVFVLSYFGTTSLQLGLFLKKRAAMVKLGTMVVFVLLGGLSVALAAGWI
jgi:cytochrome c biogenesis protein CcdA